MRCKKIERRIFAAVENKYLLESDDRLKKHLEGCSRCRAFYEQLLLENEYLIEDPVFIDSSNRIFIQLTDSIAYIVRRYIRKTIYGGNNSIDLVCHSAFQIIKPKFDKSPYGKILGCGLKIFPNQTITI